MSTAKLINEDEKESRFVFDESIFVKWEPTRNRILLVSSLAPVLNPLTGSFFLPAIPTIIDDFNASQVQVALVYSLYLLVVAVSKLFWGPFVDKYSRKWCLIVALLQFILVTYVSSFAFDMWSLIVLRSLTGIPMSCYFVISSAIISDIFPPNKRGFAMGVRSAPMLVNVLFGAPIGGLLTMYVGWRSTMVTLSFIGTIVFLLVLFYVPETLDKEKANKVPFSIWGPVKLLFQPRIFCIALSGGLSLGCMFLTGFCLSTVVADIYDLNPFVIGLSIVPSGVAGIVFSTIGGKISDIFGKRYGRGSRLLFSTIMLLVSTLFLIPFAFSFYWNVWSPIIISIVMSAIRGTSGPGFSTFCIEEHPRKAAAVLGGLSSGYMVISFLLLFVTPILAPVIGWEWICTLIAALSILICLPSVLLALITVKQFFEET